MGSVLRSAADTNADMFGRPYHQSANVGQSAAIPPAVTAKTGTRNGVIVTSVRPGSFADDISLNKGAIITEINKKPVTDEASYRAIVSTLKSGDDVVFVVQSPVQKNLNSYVGGTLP